MPPEAPVAETPAPTPSETPSTPSETPSPNSEAEAPPSIIPADESGDASASSVDWAAEADDMERSDDVDQGALPTEEPPPAETPAVSAPTASPAVATPVSPTAPPSAEPPAVTPPVAATPAEPQAPKSRTPEQEAQERRQAEELLAKYTGQLETFYTLPEDLAAQYQTEPEVVLPKLAAKLHMTVMNAVLQQVRQEMPRVFTHVQTFQTREAEAKKAFYDANPDLAQYEEQVLKTAVFFRQANPNAAPQEVIQRVGDLVRVAMGLPAKGGQPLGAPPPSASPPAPASRPAAFRPAAPGAAGPAAAPRPSGNTWEEIAEALEAEDRG